MSRRHRTYGIRFQLDELHEAVEAERVEEARQEAESRAAQFDPVLRHALRRIEFREDNRRWSSHETPSLVRGRVPQKPVGVQRKPRAERGFPDFRETVKECMRIARRVRVEREKALFFAGVAVAAPWKMRREALASADGFAAHLTALREGRDRLLHRMERHDAVRRSIREEICWGAVAPTMMMPSALQLRFDETREAVVDAFEHAEYAVHGATADVSAARSFVTSASLRRYLWRNTASVLHRRLCLRAVFSTMPLTERMNWLQEVHSCLTETAPANRSQVALGYVAAAPRTVATAWAMSRRRTRATPVVDR